MAKELQSQAGNLFFNRENAASLYFTFQIPEKIKASYNLVLAFPSFSAKSSNPIVQKIEAALNEADATWLQVGEDKIYIYGTTFSERPKPNVFQWKSRILYVGVFQPLGNASLQRKYKIRKTFFEVTWNSQIANGAVVKPELVGIAIAENTFTGITDNDIRDFKIEGPITSAPRFADLMIDVSKVLQQGAVASAKMQASPSKPSKGNSKDARGLP